MVRNRFASGMVRWRNETTFGGDLPVTICYFMLDKIYGRLHDKCGRSLYYSSGFVYYSRQGGQGFPT